MSLSASHPRALTVNGEPCELPDPPTIAALLARLGLTAGRVAVEVNEDVVPRATWETHALAAGDRVEVVHFVGGG
jgi:thiamine biosynthesis protein ThiS